MRQLQFTDCVEIVGEACQPFSGYKQYISTGAVAINHISNDDIELVDYDGKPSRANLIAKSGDILFAKMMGTKKTLHLDEDTAQNIYSTGFCAVRARPTVLTDRCLYHLLTSKAFLDQKDKNCSGATQKAITNAGLSKITIKVPSIGQQASIAQQLDRIASIIALRQSELQKLDELIKARFVELFGDLMLNPHEWPVMKISDVSLLLKSGLSRKLSDDDIGLPVIRSGNIQNGQFIYDDVKYWYKDDPQGSKTADYILEDGDILVNFINSASQIGKTAIFRDVGRDCIYTTNIFRMKLAENCNEYYYNWFAMSDYYYRQLQNIIQPAVNQASFTTVNFLKLNIPLPSMELQEQFADFVKQTDKSKVVVQKALDEAQTLFDSLMQEYFG